MTMIGNIITYSNNKSTPTTDINTIKSIISSTILTPDAILMSADVIYFCSIAPMPEYEYIRFPFHLIPDEIIEQYNLLDLFDNSVAYIEIRKGVYYLPQIAYIAYDWLRLHLTK